MAVDAEAYWHDEFTQAGEVEVRVNFGDPAIHPPGTVKHKYAYSRWTFWAVVAAVAVGFAGLVTTLLLRGPAPPPGL